MCCFRAHNSTLSADQFAAANNKPSLVTMPSKKVIKKKKVAPTPAGLRGKDVKKAGKEQNPLFEKRTRNFGIGAFLIFPLLQNDDVETSLKHVSGQHVLPKRDVTRFVRWPKYVRLQRQRAVLYQRLKVPPPINQFRWAVDRNLGALSPFSSVILPVDLQRNPSSASPTSTDRRRARRSVNVFESAPPSVPRARTTSRPSARPPCRCLTSPAPSC